MQNLFIILFMKFRLFILRQKGTLCGPISDGYESRVIQTDIKEDRDNRKNQQVYSASPVKTVDKANDSGINLMIWTFRKKINIFFKL